MHAQIDLAARLSCLTLCLRPAVKQYVPGPLPVLLAANASSQASRRKYRDPYAISQARQRKAANMRRQKELRKEREEAIGDPVQGITTPFLESFDTATPAINMASNSAKGKDESTGSPKSPASTPLNHFVKPSELVQAIHHSYILTEPLPSRNADLRDPAAEAVENRQHAEAHERATAALARILSLTNGNQKDKTRYNIQRCIEIFGRHNTDSVLKQRAPSIQPHIADKTPRAGPDTGSPEVQIAILTAKIRVLANHLERPHCQNDKVNKRNLRILVHKRQKLLGYLRRKERGSDRWQNVVQTLGLTDGTWKGEISL